MDLGEIKKAAANFLVLVKLKVMDDNVCKLHIGPRAEALAHSQIFLIFCPVLQSINYDSKLLNILICKKGIFCWFITLRIVIHSVRPQLLNS